MESSEVPMNSTPTKRGRPKSPGRSKASGRSRGRSRSRSRGRTPSGRAKTPPRQTKPAGASKNDVESSSTVGTLVPNKETQANHIGAEEAPGNTANGMVLNGTGAINDTINSVVDRIAGRTSISSLPRPKINTKIFDNIELTPSRPSHQPKEPPVQVLDTVSHEDANGPVKMINHAANNVEQLKQQRLLKKIPAKVFLALFIAMLVIVCVFVGYYYRDAMSDYYVIAKHEVRKMWRQDEL